MCPLISTPFEGFIFARIEKARTNKGFVADCRVLRGRTLCNGGWHSLCRLQHRHDGTSLRVLNVPGWRARRTTQRSVHGSYLIYSMQWCGWVALHASSPSPCMNLLMRYVLYRKMGDFVAVLFGCDGLRIEARTADDRRL